MNISSIAAATIGFSTAWPVLRNQKLRFGMGASDRKQRLAYPLMAVKLLMGIHREALLAWIAVAPTTFSLRPAYAARRSASR